ncbi:hypothetical protein PO124_03730 [Bacillus licheniformis]|nr:hypothetical protein [Bacillus licheniformis]
MIDGNIGEIQITSFSEIPQRTDKAIDDLSEKVRNDSCWISEEIQAG